MRRRFLAACALGLLMATASLPARAVEPGEMLKDPQLETRARALSEGLRCLVCQNQSIDESDATLAKDLRILLRERIAAGDSDQQVLDYLVGRYGEFILLKPRMAWHTVVLWLTPVLVLVIGAGVTFAAARRRKPQPAEPLSADDRAKLDRILAGDE